MPLSKTQNPLQFSKIDILTMAYCIWILIYMAIGWNKAHEPWRFFPLYSLTLVMVIILANLEHTLLNMSRSGTLWKHFRSGFLFLRSIYPVFLFGFFYTSLFSVNRIIIPNWQDPFFMKLDYNLFGYYPSLEWGRQTTNPWLHELFHFAYFAYYPMIFGLPVYLYFKSGTHGGNQASESLKNSKALTSVIPDSDRESRNPFTETIFCLSYVFYLCYFIFSLLPVIGGRFIPEAMELTKQSRGFLFSNIMAMIYRTTEHLGGAFPSSHVAIAVVLTISALRYTRVLGYIFIVLTFFLTMSTVFCHYHWFVDAISGIATGILGFFLALKAQKWIKI